jgi:hypothetical protein
MQASGNSGRASGFTVVIEWCGHARAIEARAHTALHQRWPEAISPSGSTRLPERAVDDMVIA